GSEYLFHHCSFLTLHPLNFVREQSTPTSAAVGRFLRFGAVALIIGAVLMLCASMAALYLWKVSDKNVYNVRYSMNINGEVREGSVEIDSDNNLERFKTGSGDKEAVEIHDFQIGITGIRFFGGDKCYIKSQIKANLPHMGAHNKETLMFDLTDEIMPVRFDEEFLIWVAAEQPLKDTSFLSNKILGLCGELPIYWLQPTYPKDGERRKRDTQRAKRQFNMEEFEAAAEERDPVSHTEDDTSRVAEEEEGAQSTAGSAYNPENPYHVSARFINNTVYDKQGSRAGEFLILTIRRCTVSPGATLKRSGAAREEGAVTFDTMLDHQGICCSECQRSYTHCQRICEPLRGYWPWPYNYRGCQVACRVIMPCRWQLEWTRMPQCITYEGEARRKISDYSFKMNRVVGLKCCCKALSPVSVLPSSPVSVEFMEVRALDGRFITVVSTQAQTDWEWVEQSLSFSCQVQKEIEDPKFLKAEMASMDADSSEDENKTEYDMPCVGPPRLIAYKPEPKQTPHAGKVPEVESKQDVHLAQCDYCQQLCQPFTCSKLLENETDFERLFCCERAKQMANLILEEREKLAQEESDRKIAVGPHVPIMSEEEREATKEQAKQRNQQRFIIRHVSTRNFVNNLTMLCHSSRKLLRSSTKAANAFAPYVQMERVMFCILLRSAQSRRSRTRQSYPSGRAAIIISSTEAADFTYIILEDKDKAPSIKGIFTNKGHSTCYYPNGMIWLNLTPVGGVCLSEAGAMRRRWNWLYCDPHVRDLPFKPLTFALGPHISVRIHSQDRMHITFAHQQNNIRFSVGSKLKHLHISSGEYLTINAFDGRVVTRISAGTQTDWRHEEEPSQDYKYLNQDTSKAPHKHLELTSEQMSVLSWGEYPEDGLQWHTHSESVPKNMKSELEISPDNQVLDSLGEETPQTLAACQGETKESLTNLDKISTSSGSDSSLQTVLNICCKHCQQPKKPPVTGDQIASSVDPKEFFCCEKAWTLSEILLKGAAVIVGETVTDRDPAMQKDQRVNLTPWGGTHFSDTGHLKKQWSWLDNTHHTHAPPWQPLCLTLSTHINIRIQSQEHICIVLTAGGHSVRLNVGAKVKSQLNQGKGLTLPGPDMLQRYLQQQSAEINVLLQNIQSLITYQKTVSPRKVKPQQSLISQMERQRLPTKQQQSAKETP
ncbi:hypothetical protein L3Q82_017519, partial [Scortum barcoo]